MSTFTLPNTHPAIPVRIPSELTQETLLSFKAFKTWLATLQQSLQLQQNPSHPNHAAPYKLRSIAVQACDYFSAGRLGFLKLKAEVSNDDNDWVPGAVFLRGGSVAMLLVLRPEDDRHGDEEYVILTVQPRIAAGSLAFVELPAGMLDDSGSFAGKAAEEIKEETGLQIEESELIDMTHLTMQKQHENQKQQQQNHHMNRNGNICEDESDEEPHLQNAVYPSPGGCDEFIPMFLARKTLSRHSLNELKGKLTGLRDQGEKITLKLCRLDQLWKVGARDGKTLAALALYEGLKREGLLPPPSP